MISSRDVSVVQCFQNFTLIIISAEEAMLSSLSVFLLATLRKKVLMEIFREGWQWVNEQMINFWWQSRSLSGYRDCFPNSSLLGDMKVVSTDCAARRCSAGHALSGIATATTITSLHHWPKTDSHVRRALAEVCTVPVLLVTSPAGAVAKYCEEHVCLSVRLSVCASVCPPAYLRNHMSNLYQFFVHVAYGWGSVLLWKGDEIPMERGNSRGFPLK